MAAGTPLRSGLLEHVASSCAEKMQRIIDGKRQVDKMALLWEDVDMLKVLLLFICIRLSGRS